VIIDNDKIARDIQVDKPVDFCLWHPLELSFPATVIGWHKINPAKQMGGKSQLVGKDFRGGLGSSVEVDKQHYLDEAEVKFHKLHF